MSKSIEIGKLNTDGKYAGLIPKPSKEDVKRIMASIKRAGILQAVIVNSKGDVLEGHTRIAIAKRLGLKAIPAEVRSFKNPEEERAFVLDVNLARRHLPITRIVEYFIINDNETPDKQIAKMAGTTEGYVRIARLRLKKAKVSDGKVKALTPTDRVFRWARSVIRLTEALDKERDTWRKMSREQKLELQKPLYTVTATLRDFSKEMDKEKF